MNLHFPASTMKTTRPRHAHGIVHPDVRRVDVLRIANWLAEGIGIARAQPLLWLPAILGGADFSTLFELAPPLLAILLAALLVPLWAGAMMLMQERSRNARPWTIGETLEAVNGHRNALFTIGLSGAAIAGIGYLLSFAVFHMTVSTSLAANGAHNLAIVYGVQQGAQNALEPLISMPFYVIAIAAVWFAPALVVLHNLSPVDAMTASLRAALRNWPVALVYAAAIGADILLAPVVPMLARGVVVTPLVSTLIVLSMYGSYRDLFIAR
ncbi:BPSS1780 family membrane protein [Caballeronia sp.]|uniref:BPSS1780 family membrane protein n=1 Tax=Caballeronia sp. TaxID=1931223 RepID=UPI003C5C2057